MDLNELTDEELESIVATSPCTERASSLFAEAVEREGVHILIDEADGWYWRRRLDRKSALSDDEVETLLSKRPFSTARKMLGEAARLDKLTDNQLHRINEEEPQDRFIRKQVSARRLIRQIQSYVDMGIDKAAVAGIVRELCELGTAWPVLEVCDDLDADILAELSHSLDQFNFSRGDRHVIREAIGRTNSGKGDKPN